MTTGGVTTGYKWDMGWNVISEVNNVGALMRSYVHNPQAFGRATLAHVDGTNPATGAYRYYHHDHLGSTRSVFDQNKNLAAAYRYSPYGDIFAATNTAATTHLYTGHDWNPATGTYFAPYRHYSPRTARWLTRDPLGMVDGPNVYVYTGNSPIVYIDPLGLSLRGWFAGMTIAAGATVGSLAALAPVKAGSVVVGGIVLTPGGLIVGGVALVGVGIVVGLSSFRNQTDEVLDRTEVVPEVHNRNNAVCEQSHSYERFEFSPCEIRMREERERIYDHMLR